MDSIPSHSSARKKRKVLDSFFARTESLKASDSLFVKFAIVSTVVFGLLFVVQFSTQNTVPVATTGGGFTEGIVGTPRFVNPVLAVTRADKDLTTLVYDGLMRLGHDGILIPSIAESLTVSEDGLTYNLVLKQNINFHDGVALTARDVVFTFNRIQDPIIASPLRGNFDGVRIEEVGEYEIHFILSESYTPFIENLTFGILPEHIWSDAGSEEFPFSQHNSEPVGSGPFKISNIVHNASGIPETYILTANTNYHEGAPKIETIKIQFFPTEERLQNAYRRGLIDAVVGVDATRLELYEVNETTHALNRIALPRTFAVFINQNKSAALRDNAARRALNVALNRDELIAQVLYGYGNSLYSPIPPHFGVEAVHATNTPYGNIDAARDILRTGGWKFNLETQVWEKEIDGSLTPLTFNISTINSATFESTAEFLRTTWGELGVPIGVKQFEQTDLTQAIIRPRDFEALLFGTQLGRPLDYYSFWHSSQRNDPGLNISLYANITTDSILAEMRRNPNGDARQEAIRRFVTEIDKEVPAIFLYAPELLYLIPNRIQNTHFAGISEPHDRFMNVHEWYIETDSVWPFFRNTEDEDAN